MENIKDVKDRIKSVKEIRKITRAMKMVATAKYKKAYSRLSENQAYVKSIENLLWRIQWEVVLRYNKYFVAHTDQEKRLLIVVTADKGLCGGFNANVIRAAMKQIKDTDLFIIGKKGKAFFHKLEGAKIIGEKADIFGKLNYKICASLARHISRCFAVGSYTKIDILYTHFESMGKQSLKLEQMFPLTRYFENRPDNLSTRKLVYEPSSTAVFDNLINHYIEIQLLRILLESELSEQITRMNAMDAATKNASELIDNLILAYNRARQAIITKEIIEIVSGAEALNK